MGQLIEYDHGIYAFDSGYVRPLLASIHLIVENGRAAFVDSGTNASLPAAGISGVVLGILLWYAFDRLLDVTLPLGAWFN